MFSVICLSTSKRGEFKMRSRMLKSKSFTLRKRIAVITLGLLLCCILYPYLQVEVLTIKYRKEVSSLYAQTNMIDDDNYFKVLKANKNNLKIIYISKTSKNICYYSKINNEYVLKDWYTLYSIEGSADDFMYPFYPLKRQ